MMYGARFRVQGSRFRVQCSGCSVFSVEGLVPRVSPALERVSLNSGLKCNEEEEGLGSPLKGAGQAGFNSQGSGEPVLSRVSPIGPSYTLIGPSYTVTNPFMLGAWGFTRSRGVKVQ